MWELDGKAILVTGASGGIGGATVTKLKDAGAKVYAAGRSRDELEKLAAQTGCETLIFDLTSEDEIRRAIEGLPLWGW